MNALIMALDSIWEKKGRSFLTMLGIIIGVTAVLVLVALVAGYNADVTAYYEKLGVNKVEVEVTWYDPTRSTDLTDDLARYVNDDLGQLTQGVTPSHTLSATVRHGGESAEEVTVSLGGTQWDVCGNYTLDRGRGILDYDIENASPVCVIGSYLTQTFFPYSDPIGQTVTVNGHALTVVGTLYQKDGSQEDSMDNCLWTPYTLDRVLLGSAYVTRYTVKVDKSRDMDQVMTALERYFAQTVSDRLGEVELENGNAAMSESTSEMTSMSVVLGGVAAIALLVGGIGIMNIMLVTVTERTREIGIKKSIGAPKWEIVTQFLIEAAILSSLGGLAGIALGYLLAAVLGQAMYGVVSFPGALVTVGAFLFSAAIGILFGLYPAVKAAGLQPVDALRSE